MSPKRPTIQQQKPRNQVKNEKNVLFYHDINID